MKVKFKCKPMERNWLTECRRRGWTIGSTLRQEELAPASNIMAFLPMTKYEKLKRRLLKVAGQAICIRHEPDIHPIVNRGQFFRGYNARMMKGDPCRCHSNSAAMWDANRNKVRIVTGYALTDDGMWCQHTWCIDKDDKPIETTEKRLLYYGFILNDDEAQKFLDEN